MSACKLTNLTDQTEGQRDREAEEGDEGGDRATERQRDRETREKRPTAKERELERWRVYVCSQNTLCVDVWMLWGDL